MREQLKVLKRLSRSLRWYRAIFRSFLMVAAFLLSPNSLAAPENLYPPYPDIWERTIPAHKEDGRYAILAAAFHLPNGDILIGYGAEEKNSRQRITEAISFFDGIKVPSKDISVINKLPRAENHVIGEHGPFAVAFEDGSSLIQTTSGHPGSCGHGMDVDFVLRDSKGAKIFRKKIIKFLSRPVSDEGNGACDDQLKVFVMRAVTPLWRAILLNDGTMILTSRFTNKALRVDKSLRTRAELGDEWLIIDSVEWYGMETPQFPDYQALYDFKIKRLGEKFGRDKGE